MRKVFLALLVGFILGQLFAPGSVAAQSIARLYGTVSGAPIALVADSSGRLTVVIQ